MKKKNMLADLLLDKRGEVDWMRLYVLVLLAGVMTVFFAGAGYSASVILKNNVTEGGNITEDGYVSFDFVGGTYGRTNSTARLRFGVLDIAGNVRHGVYIEFNTSFIPDTATIDEVWLNISVYTTDTVTCGVSQMRLQPSTLDTSQDEHLYNDTINGTVYNVSSDWCQTVGWKYINLSVDATTDLQNQLSADWFAVGINSSIVEDASNYGEFNSSNSGEGPELHVTYTEAFNNSIVHISYYVGGVTNDLKYCNNTGGTWTCATLDSTGIVGGGSSIVMDSNNITHISYYDDTEDDLKYCNNTGWEWTCVKIIDAGNVSGAGRSTSIAVDSSDILHISYYDKRTTDLDLGYCNNTGWEWSCVDIESTNDVGKWSSLAIDSSNIIHISHFDNTNNDLRYCNNTGWEWSCIDIVNTGTTGAEWKSNSIAIDSNDILHISYYDTTADDLKYCNNTGNTWSCDTVDSSGILGRWQTPIAIDSNNVAHISYLVDDVEDLKYCNNTANTWSCALVDSATAVGQFSSLAIDSSDIAHISYLDNTNDYLKYCNNTANVWSCDTVDTSEGRETSIFIEGMTSRSNIDLFAPTMTITYPANTTYFLNVSNINYTYTETNPDSCWYSVDNGDTNSTIVNVGINWTDVVDAEGSNNWTVWCNDTSNNEGTASVVFVQDATTPPGITIEYPANTTYASSHFSFNITATEQIDSCNFTLNSWTDYFNMTSFNATLFYYTNESIEDGQYTASFECNDTANNMNNTEAITFLIDTIPPNITNIASIGIEQTSASITWETNESANSSVYYGTTINTDTTSSSASTTTSHSIGLTSLLASTLYYYNVSSCDSVANCNQSEQYNFTTLSSGGGGGGGGCTGVWTCGNWGECVNGNQTRGCSNDCGSTRLEIRNCAECNPNWQCTEWSGCFGFLAQNTSEGYGDDMKSLTPTGVITGFVSKKQTGIFSFFKSVCNQGEKRCGKKENERQECEKRWFGSIFYWKTIKCGKNESCELGECVKEVACNENEIRCNLNNEVEKCVVQANKLSWKTIEECGSLICQQGECVCDNKCLEGEKTCGESNLFSMLTGAPYLECVRNNNGCLVWDNKVCGFGESCEAGKCVIKHCTNNIKDYDETDIDCGGSCVDCVLPSPGEDEYLLNLEGVVELEINKGDKILVTYKEKRQNSILLAIKSQATPYSENIKEIHSLKLDEINDSIIKVSVSSDLITKYISLGQTEEFIFEQGSFFQSRTCADLNNCGDNTTKPDEKKPCDEACEPSWVCGNWGECVNGKQTRSCIDEKYCGSGQGKPEIERECRFDLLIEHYPVQLDLVVAENEAVIFKIIAEDNSDYMGDKWLKVKWHVNSGFVKEDAAGSTITSSLVQSFPLSMQGSSISSDIIARYIASAVVWNVWINESAQENCEENWKCEWSECKNGYSYAKNCIDMEGCGTNIDKPEKVRCGEEDCTPDIECEKWQEECRASYTYEDVIYGNIFYLGEKTKTCRDKEYCIDTYIESKPCDNSLNIRAEKVIWCEEEYVEIYKLPENKLVSRIKETKINNAFRRIDIGFIETAFEGYCDYCFDGLKNYDEEGIDCGGSCPACRKARFRIPLILIILTIFIITTYFILILEKRRRRKWGLVEII